MIDHFPGCQLCQKKWTAGINGKDPIITVFSCFQNVHSLSGCYTGVVNEYINFAKFTNGGFYNIFSISIHRNITLNRQKFCPFCFNSFLYLKQSLFIIFRIILAAVSNYVKSGLCQFNCDPTSNPSAGTRYQSNPFC